MAIAPSEAEIRAQLSAAVNWFQKLYLRASVDSPNLVGLEDTLSQAVEGNFTPDSLQVIRKAARGSVSSALSRATVKAALWPCVKEYGVVVYSIPANLGETDFLRELHKAWCDAGTPVTFKRRNPSFGSITAGGSNVGTGTINRLTTDWRGHVLQNVYAEAKKVICKKDRASGSVKQEEEFEIRGVNEPLDNLELAGSGQVAKLRGISARNSEAYLSNPSFSSFVGTAASAFSATTDLTDWVLSTAANVTPITADYYRDFEGDTTPTCVRFTDNVNISQKFSTRRATFDYYTPYYCQIAYKRESSCDGNLTLAFGGVTATVALSAGSSWAILRIALGSSNWPRQFVESDTDLVITLDSRTTGTLLVDDVIVAPFQKHAGIWYAPVGGTTPFKIDDVFTWTDSIASDAVIARWIAWAFDFSIPTDASPVVSDPA